MDVRAATIAFTIVVITVVTFRVVNWVWFRPKRLEKLLRAQGFNGNSYRLLFGDIKEFAEKTKEAKSKPIHPISNDISPYVLPYFHHIFDKYGTNSFIWFGPNPRLNIMDPVLIKEILSKPNIFHKPHPEPVSETLLGGVSVLEGEKWAKHRKIISPAFHLEKIKDMIPAIYASCTDMIKKWETLIPEAASSEVDVWPYLNDLIGDMLTRSAFNGANEEGTKIFQVQQKQADAAAQIAPLFYIPGWRFLPIKGVKRFKKLSSDLEALLRVIINKRVTAIEMGESQKDDLLGILLESNSQEIKERGIGMSMEEVMEECKLFYFAGSETTSNLLVWTMILLSKHPMWQVRAREEVSQVFGDKEPEFNDLNQLKIVTMILYEVLRLYPPAILLARAISKETKLGNMTLPAGTHFNLPIIHVHRDLEIWGEDITEFKPERFSEGVLNATKGKLSFLPFGGGARICIGQNFAMIEAKMAIATILRRFSFELSPSYKHSPSVLITISPQFGAQLILRKI